MKLLEIENLVVSYPSGDGFFDALKGVSLFVSPQESLALIGQSGCGKTSLISALLPPSARRDRKISGKIFYQGHPLWENKSSPIAFIFQDPLSALNPTRKIKQQLLETLLLGKNSYREAEKEALYLLHEVALPNPEKILSLYPHEMSRGMLQRVTIAIALAMKSFLIVADEPTTALDVTTSSQILNLLQALQKKKGFSLLLISHDLGSIAKLCSRAIVLHEGIIIEEGSTQQLFSSPQHQQTKKLIKAAQFFLHLPATPMETL
jgi:ABC-type dipeptide/oligopeptide/nickel transport system ATPase component